MAHERPPTLIQMVTEVVHVGLFLLALTLPLADRILGLDSTPELTEKRALAPPPEWPRNWAAVRAFPSAYERYWNDTFGFRRALVRSYNRTLVALGTSPIPERVVVGRNRWLFYAAEKALEDYQGTRPFSAGELARWRCLFEMRHDWLADRRIPYILIFAPSKETIYPEHMPTWIRRSGTVHRLDQLLGALAARPEIAVFDPRALLRAAKNGGDVYRATDTHWTSRGVLLVQQEIARRLRHRYPAIAPIEPSATFAQTSHGSGDLAEMIGVNGEMEDEWEERGLAAPRARHVGAPTKDSSWTEVEDTALPRGVFFHDSFGAFMSPFLAEYFAHLRHMWTPLLDPMVVEAERAQIVIQEIAARFLAGDPPEDSTRLADNSGVRGRFDASASVLLRVPGDSAAITAVSDLSVSPEPDGGVTLRVATGRGSAQLSALNHASQLPVVLRVRLESPAESRLEVFYQTRADASYDGSRRAWWPLSPGSNDVWFMLCDPEVDGRLRLDLTAPGTYHLKALEARTVSERPAS